MNNDLLVGYRRVGPGIQTARGGSTAEAIMAQAHGAFWDACARNSVMHACNAVAGINPGTALSTTPPLSLWNPPGSGKYLAILQVTLGYVSGTYGAGCVYLLAIPTQQTVPSSGTEIVPLSGLISAPRGVGRVWAGGTYVAAGTILRPSFNLTALLATTAVNTLLNMDEVNGSIICPPGTGFAVQAVAAAGSTPLVGYGFVWEEGDF